MLLCWEKKQGPHRARVLDVLGQRALKTLRNDVKGMYMHMTRRIYKTDQSVESAKLLSLTRSHVARNKIVPGMF